MPSRIDPTRFADGQPVSKADLRQALSDARAELEHGGFVRLAATDAVERRVANKLGDVEVSIADFGAVLDGTTDDTAAFQRAINYLATRSLAGKSQLTIRGACRLDPATLDWSAFRDSVKRRLTILVDGRLNLLSSLVLTPRIHLVGIGGASISAQFQIGPTCLVTQVGNWNDPVIQLKGTEDLYLQGVYVASPFGPGIQVGHSAGGAGATQSALCRLRDVGVLTRVNTPTSEGLRIENTFWLWVNNFAFNAQSGSGPSIHIADSFDPGIGQNTTGLVQLEDGVISGEGMWWNRGFSRTQDGFHYWFKNVHFENCRSAFVVVKSPYVAYRDIRIERVNVADMISGEIALIDNEVGGNLYDLDVESINLWQRNTRIVMGKPIARNMRVRAFRSVIYSSPSGQPGYRQYDDIPLKYEFHADGEVEFCDGFRGGSLLPSMIPADALVYPSSQDISTWAREGAVAVTGGAIAPDGTSTAYRLDFSASGVSAVSHSDNASVITDHYVIVGCWFKAADINDYITGSQTELLRLYMGGAVSFYWDGEPANGSPNVGFGKGIAHYSQHRAGWVLISEARRFNASSGPSDMRLQIYSNQGRSVLASRPFVVALPATRYTRREVARLLAKLGHVDSTARPGTLAQLGHQTFRTGVGSTAARPAAKAVGAGAQWFDATLGKPIWSDGAHWRDASGSLV